MEIDMSKQIDKPNYMKNITGEIPRFDERNTTYSMGDRLELPSQKQILAKGKELKEPGYTPEDFALLWGARTVDYLVRKNVFARDEAVSGEKVPIDDTALWTQKIKYAARWFGASMVGICRLNHQWVYSHWGDHNAILTKGGKPGDPLELPGNMKYAIVMAVEMDYEDIKRSPAVANSTDLGYSKMAFIASSLSTFIRQLGYHAIPSGNDTGLTIPMAVDAGLGELGRNGLLISAEYGPRVRLCKVFTELPLIADKPVDLGLQHFCETCKKCAKECPSGAIQKGEMTDQPVNVSSGSGVLKWPINAHKCYNFWNANGTWCTNCIRTCPWNKPSTLFHKFNRSIIMNAPWSHAFFVWIDDVFGYGKQTVRPWKLDGYS